MTIQQLNSFELGNAQTSTSTELLVVGPGVKDVDILLKGLARPMGVLQLVPGINPLAQIAQAVAGRTETDTIHILAHGEPGVVHLGGEPLDIAGLDRNSDEIEALRDALAADAKIALWSCSVAWMESGQQFIAALESQTGASVFASDRPVGASALGGDWQIGTRSPFMKSTEAAYPHTLPTFTFSTATDNGLTVSETVNGVTVTVADDSGDNGRILSGATGFDGVFVFYGSGSGTVTFDQAVSVTSFHIGGGNALAAGLVITLTPTGSGSSIPLSGANQVNNGFDVTPTDWTNVTGFTISLSQSPTFAIDTIVFGDAVASDVASVVAGTFTGDVTEGNEGDAAVTATGPLSISDADAGDDPSFADVTSTAGGNSFGSFVLTSGTWTYTLNQSAVQDLDAADTVTDTITFTATDGTTQVITVTITGTADAAVVTGTATGSVTEGNTGDAAVTASGTLTITDADANDTPSFADVTSTAGGNAYGSFALTGSTWTYTLDQSKVQDLAASATVTDSITFTADDNTTQVVAVTITGSNDGATIAGTLTGTVGEDATGTITGTATATDVDNTDNSFTAVTNKAGTHGSLTIDAAGNWTYDLNEARTTVQALKSGGTLTDSIGITSADGTAANVVVTINGADDAAVAGGTVTGNVTEGDVGDTAVTATGALTITDVDAGDSPSFEDVTSTLGGNAYGSFALTGSTWTYTLDQSKVQDLAASATVTDNITFTADDNTTQVVTVTLTGSNDAAVIGGGLTGTVGEDATGTITGTATATDVDGTDNSFTAAASITGTYGTLAMAANGVWTYDLNETSTAVQAAQASATLTDTIAVSAADGTAANVVVTINGANDAPTAASVPDQSVFLQVAKDLSLAATTVADVDTTNLTVTVSVDTGSLASDAAGGNHAGGAGVAATSATIITLTGTAAQINAYFDDTDELAFTSANSTNSVTLTVTVNDDVNSDVTDTATISVVDGDTPIATTISYNGTEDTAVTLNTVGMAVSQEAAGIDTLNYLTITGITGGTLALGAGAATKATDGATDTAAVGAITNGALINPADIGRLTFTPTANSTTAGTVIYTVTDNGPDTSPTATLTINLAAVQDVPTATDNAITLNEDTSYTFKVADFNFADVDSGDALASVRVDVQTLAAGDTLKLSGVDVTDAQVITAANIANLIYTPVANGNGAARSSFTFTVNDGTANAATTSTLTLNVTDVAEPATPTPTPTPSSGSETPMPTPTPNVIVGGNSKETLEGSSQNDTIDGGSGGDLLEGSLGDDSVVGGDGNDVIVGGDAGDNLDLNNLAASGDDTLMGGGGDDLIVGGAFDTATQTAHETGFGKNLIRAGSGNDTVFGDGQDDNIGGGTGKDDIKAGGGNDRVYASTGEDTVNGGLGDDTLFGGDGDDSVDGGADDDQIWGGAGNDSLTGGDGNDTFAFITGFGSDVISDFSSADGNKDILDLSLLDGLTLASLKASATFSDGNTQLAVGDHGIITLTGIDETELDALIAGNQILVA